MAKIQIPRLPQAAQEYSQAQMNTMIQTLDQMIFLLNNSYTPEILREEDEQITWFLG
tara:strand:- start:10980 stop:11150 length:171 start_codon:yes stop_codon:yes gene_type:complete